MKIKANDGKTYDAPDNPVWHSGPPPEIGWWPASVYKDAERVRYWDGIKWSTDCKPTDNESRAADLAKFEADYPTEVQWTDRWWLTGSK